MHENALGDFLRARRGRVDPASIGLRTLGHRRTSGLRREEVASLAGISIEYLVRLERGRDRNPSPAVIRGLADALQLDDAETAHLAGLCAESVTSTEDSLEVDPDLQRLLDSMAAPAMVTSRFFDLLALNAAGAELYAGWSLAPGANLAEHLFLDPAAEWVYVDRDELAQETVANLRSQVGADVTHPRFTDLVGRLSVGSPLFAALWARNDVAPKTGGRKRVRHPRLGDLELRWSTLTVAAAPGQQVVAYQGEPGSSTEVVLARLQPPEERVRRV